MSIAFMVFMIVPILAPTFGWAVLQFGNWRAIFGVIAVLTLGIMAWFWMRMPETLEPDNVLPITPQRILADWRQTLGDRLSLGYTLAATALMGSLYGYLNSIQQIMADVFHRPNLLALIFATTSVTMAVANLMNSRVVMRLGTRLISHGSLCALVVVSIIHLAAILIGWESLVSFAVFQALTLGCFGLAVSNFSAMAMENMGRIAGTASSVQGFVSVTAGAVIGAMIGQAFNGTTVPLVAGFLLAGLVALAFVALTERGRLFRPAIASKAA